MSEDDPEKRISELEQQLSDMGPANPGQQTWNPAPPTDWQYPPQTPVGVGYPASRSSSVNLRLIFIIVPVVLGLIGVIVAITVVLRTSSSLSSLSNPGGSAATSGPKQLQTVDGLNALLALTRDQFGNTMGYRMVVYPDYAVMDRADPQDSRRKFGYYYKGGNWTDWSSPSAKTSSDELADLGEFDVTAVIATLGGAAQALELNNPDTTYIIIEGAQGGSLDLSIYVSDHGLSGYMEVNPDGSVKKLHPPS